MFQNVLAITVFVGTLFAAEAVGAQCQPIPDSVERLRPKPYISGRISEIAVTPLHNVLKSADLVLLGKLAPSRVYLSEDQCTLYTDYVVTPLRVIVPAPSSRPRASLSAITIRTWGGETTIGGVPVRIYDSNVRKLSSNRPYLLFLKFNKDSEKYEIFDQGAYALEVGTDNRLISGLEPKAMMDPAIENNDLEAAIKAIQQRKSQ